MPATYKILQSADHADSFNNRDAFALDVLVGLSSMPKSISSKYFYDQRGSELFRQISLLPEYWSQGYAYEAAEAVMRHAREVLRLGRVLAITTTDNESSMSLLGKLGFHFDRLVRLGNDPTELRLYFSES